MAKSIVIENEKESNSRLNKTMKAFEDAFNSVWMHSKSYEDAMQKLNEDISFYEIQQAFAVAVAISTLRKASFPVNKKEDANGKIYIKTDSDADGNLIADDKGNKLVSRLYSQIGRDAKYMEQYRKLSNEYSKIIYNKNGDAVNDIDTAKEKAFISRYLTDTLSDSYDMVQDAHILILEEVKKACERSKAPINLEEEYQAYTSTKHTIVLDMYTDTEEEEEEQNRKFEYVVKKPTTPLKIIFRGTHRKIFNSRAVQVSSFVYDYIQDYIEMDDGTKENIYYRLPKYYDMTGNVIDASYYDSGTEKTLNSLSYFGKMESIIKRLNLTDKQRKVLDLRLQGLAVLGDNCFNKNTSSVNFGSTYIAKKLHVKVDAIKDHINYIKIKAVKAGLTWENVAKQKNALLLSNEIESSKKERNVYNIDSMHIRKPFKESDPIPYDLLDSLCNNSIYEKYSENWKQKVESSKSNSRKRLYRKEKPLYIGWTHNINAFIDKRVIFTATGRKLSEKAENLKAKGIKRKSDRVIKAVRKRKAYERKYGSKSYYRV